MPGPVIAQRIRGDSVGLPYHVVYHGGALRADGVGGADVEVLEGTSTTGEIKDVFDVAVSASIVRFYERGIDFPQGLFVDIGANVAVFVVYYSLPERDTSPTP